MRLRKDGLDVPKELLEQKFAHNRARHNKDLKKQHDFMVANMSMQEAFLMELKELNRVQAE